MYKKYPFIKTNSLNILFLRLGYLNDKLNNNTSLKIIVLKIIDFCFEDT